GNREIPPLRYDIVQRLREAFPGLTMIVNGGLRDAATVQKALGWCDGTMLCREADHRPQILSQWHQLLSPAEAGRVPTREQLMERMARYAERETGRGTRLSAITRHMLGLYA